MSYLLHGHTAMGWIDLIPRCGPLYIGGHQALYHPTAMLSPPPPIPTSTTPNPDLSLLANSSSRTRPITHILSIIEQPVTLPPNIPPTAHLHVPLPDDPNANLLAHFGTTTRFISIALDAGGAVFVHCAMGKSRSAAVVVAYLMARYGVGWEEGLPWVCEGRGVCEPNVGFREQLGVWGRMLAAGSEEERREVYEGWVGERFLGEVWEWEAREAKEERDRGKGKDGEGRAKL